MRQIAIYEEVHDYQIKTPCFLKGIGGIHISRQQLSIPHLRPPTPLLALLAILLLAINHWSIFDLFSHRNYCRFKRMPQSEIQ